MSNYVGIYEVFCGHKNFFIGKQPEPFPDTTTVSCCSVSYGSSDRVSFYVYIGWLRIKYGRFQILWLNLCSNFGSLSMHNQHGIACVELRYVAM